VAYILGHPVQLPQAADRQNYCLVTAMLWSFLLQNASCSVLRIRMSFNHSADPL